MAPSPASVSTTTAVEMEEIASSSSSASPPSSIIWKCGSTVFDRSVGIYGHEDPANRMSIADLLGCEAKGSWLHIAGYPKNRSTRSGCCMPSSNGRRSRVSFSVKCSSSSEAESHALSFRRELAAVRNTSLERKMLVSINPQSGPGKALKTWRSSCKQLFLDACINLDERVTERKDHALDIVRDMDAEELLSYECIVVVSGDGLVFEILQGIMQRKDWSKIMRSVQFGVVHGGSGNGLANSVCDASDCRLTPRDAAFVVVTGEAKPMDIAAVDVGTSAESAKRYYSFLSLSWAFMGDVDIESESLRWMGDARFVVQSVKRILKLRKYKGRLSFLPADNAGMTSSMLGPRIAEDAKNVESYWERVERLEREKKEEEKRDADNNDDNDDDEEEEKRDADDEEGEKDSPPAIDSPPELHLLPAIGEPVPDNWQVIEDTFLHMWNCNCSYMASDAIAAPSARVSDGFHQLTFLRKHGPKGASRGKMLSYLLGLDKGNVENSKSVEMCVTQAYRLEPLSGEKTGHIVLDGELVDYTAIQLQVLKGLGRIKSL